MKKLIVVIILLICSSLIYAETKQFIRLSNSGSIGTATVSDGTTSSKSTTSSYGVGFSAGLMNDSYSLGVSSSVGNNGIQGIFDYYKLFGNSLYAALAVGISSQFSAGFGVSAGTGFGVCFWNKEMAATTNIGLTAEIVYQSYSDFSLLMGVVGFVISDSFSIGDSLSLGVGLTLGGIPLFTRCYFKDSGTAVSLSSSAFSVSITTSVTYQYDNKDSSLI